MLARGHRRSTDTETRIKNRYSYGLVVAGSSMCLRLAKAAQGLQRSIVILRPGVSAIDANVVLVSARRGKEGSRRDADALRQRGPMQFKSIDFRGQFNP